MAQTSQSAQPGMAENVAGLLCYVLGWVTGIIFFLIDKRPFVKFHAAQSLAFHVALIVIFPALGIFLGMLHFMHLFFFGFFLYPFCAESWVVIAGTGFNGDVHHLTQ